MGARSTSTKSCGRLMRAALAALLLPGHVKALDYEAAIEKETTAAPMALAVVVEKIRLPSGMEDVGRRQEIEDDIVTTISQVILSAAQDDPGFELVDRRAADVILNEYVFQAHGFTRQVDAAKIGSFTNATHLLILSVAHLKGKRYRVQAKLVTVKEAKILSAERFDVTAGDATPRRPQEVPPSYMAQEAPKEKTPWFIKILVAAIAAAGTAQVARASQ